MTGSINGREVVRHLRGVRVFWVAAVSISKSLVGGEGSSVIFVIRVLFPDSGGVGIQKCCHCVATL
jgi:hypothetical protein